MFHMVTNYKNKTLQDVLIPAKMLFKLFNCTVSYYSVLRGAHIRFGYPDSYSSESTSLEF